MEAMIQATQKNEESKTELRLGNQEDPANVTHGVKFQLTQSAVVGFGFGTQGQKTGQ